MVLMSDEYQCTFNNNAEFVRGTAVVISMTENRKGAEFEEHRIKNLADLLSFDIVSYIDCTASFLQKRLRMLARNLHQDKDKDCFVCFVNAHGGTDTNGNGYIEDNEKVKLLTFEGIMQPFLECKYLEGKPKVFFINTRRGVNTRTDSLPQANRMHRTMDLLANISDVLAVFSTDVGDVSWRDPDGCAIFIKKLAQMVTEWNNHADLLSIITGFVDDVEEDERHTLVIESTLTKKLYWRTKIKELAPDLPGKEQLSKCGLSSVPKRTDKCELVVPSHVVGQKQHFSDIKERVLTSRAKLCAITGMTGIGKSTLAKTLFNDLEIQERFQVFWFESKDDPDIAKKQKLLIAELGETPPKIEDQRCLGEKIQQCFKDVSPFMLVLDDAWSQTHIEKILGSPLRSVIPDGCTCLITTCIKDAATALLSDLIIDLDFLNEDDSSKLFCMHAFGEEKISKGLDFDLVLIVEQTIKACGNLPGLLKVVGAEMHGKTDIGDWKMQLNLLQKYGPLEGTQWDEEIVDLPSKIDQLFCQREGRVISHNQCLVFKYLVDSTARYTKHFWIGQFQLFTSGRAFGKQLLMVLNRGLDLLRECADKDPANLAFISILLISAGEFREIVDDVTRFSNKLINLTTSCDPAKKRLLQNKVQLECSMLQDSLRLAYEQDKHALISQSPGTEKPRTVRSSWLVSSNEDGLLKRFLPSGLILETGLHPLASKIPESDLSFWSRAPVAIKGFLSDSDFEHEYKLRMKLLDTNSFHIVHILGCSESRKCLVEEQMETRLEYIQGLLPSYQFIEIALQIAKGIRDLHRENVSHGNITYSNIMLKSRKDGSYIVKLFGCENEGLVTKQQDICGFCMLLRDMFSDKYDHYLLQEEESYGPEYANIRTNLRVVLDCLIRYPPPSFEEICNRLWVIKEKYIEEVAVSSIIRKLGYKIGSLRLRAFFSSLWK